MVLLFKKTALLLGLISVASLTAVRADTLVISGVTNIIYGTATLIDSHGLTISTKTAVSIETVLGPDQDLLKNVTGIDLGQSLAAQIASDPSVTNPGSLGFQPPDKPIPSFVIAQLSNFVSVNGLGLDGSGSAVPDAAFTALYAALTTQSVAFVIKSDTGASFFTSEVNADDITTYGLFVAANANVGDAIFKSNPVLLEPALESTPYSKTAIEYAVNVNFYERNIVQQIAAVPEASSWAMMIVGFVGIGAIGTWRRRPVRSKSVRTLLPECGESAWVLKGGGHD